MKMRIRVSAGPCMLGERVEDIRDGTQQFSMRARSPVESAAAPPLEVEVRLEELQELYAAKRALEDILGARP